MFIQIESTPNPATLKFLPGTAVSPEGSVDFSDRDAAQSSPLASELFAIEGVAGVFFGPDFITVSKRNDVDWVHAKPAILGAIMDHFVSGKPLISRPSRDLGGHAESDGANEAVVAQIKELLDTRVRPAVAQDGGDITFHGYDSGVVYLRMRGACSGCPSATMTLKMGIENLLRHYIPEVTEVQPVTFA